MMLREMRRSLKRAGILFGPNVQYFTVLSEIPKGIPVLYPWLNKGRGNLRVRVRVALCTPGGIPVPFSTWGLYHVASATIQIYTNIAKLPGPYTPCGTPILSRFIWYK
jgi:hypothetical protein